MFTPKKRLAQEVGDAAGQVQRCEDPQRLALYLSALNGAVAALNAELWSDEQVAAELRRREGVGEP